MEDPGSNVSWHRHCCDNPILCCPATPYGYDCHANRGQGGALASCCNEPRCVTDLGLAAVKVKAQKNLSRADPVLTCLVSIDSSNLRTFVLEACSTQKDLAGVIKGIAHCLHTRCYNKVVK